MATKIGTGTKKEAIIVTNFTNKPIKSRGKYHQATGTTPTNQAIWTIVSAFIQTKLVEVCTASTRLWKFGR